MFKLSCLRHENNIKICHILPSFKSFTLFFNIYLETNCMWVYERERGEGKRKTVTGIETEYMQCVCLWNPVSFESLLLELQKIVNHLAWVLVIIFWSSVRAVFIHELWIFLQSNNFHQFRRGKQSLYSYCFYMVFSVWELFTIFVCTNWFISALMTTLLCHHETLYIWPFKVFL